MATIQPVDHAQSKVVNIDLKVEDLFKMHCGYWYFILMPFSVKSLLPSSNHCFPLKKKERREGVLHVYFKQLWFVVLYTLLKFMNQNLDLEILLKSNVLQCVCFYNGFDICINLLGNTGKCKWNPFTLSTHNTDKTVLFLQVWLQNHLLVVCYNLQSTVHV